MEFNFIKKSSPNNPLPFSKFPSTLWGEGSSPISPLPIGVRILPNFSTPGERIFPISLYPNWGEDLYQIPLGEKALLNSPLPFGERDFPQFSLYPLGRGFG